MQGQGSTESKCAIKFESFRLHNGWRLRGDKMSTDYSVHLPRLDTHIDDFSGVLSKAQAITAIRAFHNH